MPDRNQGGGVAGIRTAIFFIVILFLLSSCIATYKLNRDGEQKLTRAEERDPMKMYRVANRNWWLVWKKPPGTRGLNPRIRKDRQSALFHTYIPGVAVRFDVLYQHLGREEKANFVWDFARNPDHGSWSQHDPPNYGTFQMERVSKDLFVGSMTNKEGEETVFWLVSN